MQFADNFNESELWEETDNLSLSCLCLPLMMKAMLYEANSKS